MAGVSGQLLISDPITVHARGTNYITILLGTIGISNEVPCWEARFGCHVHADSRTINSVTSRGPIKMRRPLSRTMYGLIVYRTVVKPPKMVSRILTPGQVTKYSNPDSRSLRRSDSLSFHVNHIHCRDGVSSRGLRSHFARQPVSKHAVQTLRHVSKTRRIEIRFWGILHL